MIFCLNEDMSRTFQFLVIHFIMDNFSLWCHVDFSHFQCSSFTSRLTGFFFFIYVFIFLVIYYSVFMTVSILIDFPAKRNIFCSLDLYRGQQMRQSMSRCFPSYCEFSGILSSNFSNFMSTCCYPTLEQRRAITALYLVILDKYILGLQTSLYIYYYFINLFKVCTGSCFHACFHPRSICCLDGPYLLLFACKRDPSQGRSAKQILLP